MGFYVILFFVIAGFCTFTVSVDRDRKTIFLKKENSIKIGCFILFLVAGFRSMHVGTDTVKYVILFSKVDFSVFERISISEKWVYNIWCLLVKSISDNGYFFNVCCAAFVYACISHFINKYSENPTESLLLFMSLGCFFNSMNQNRQQMAAALLLLGFDFVREKRVIRMLLCCTAAVFVHHVAVFILPVYLFLIFTRRIDIRMVEVTTCVCIFAGIMFSTLIVLFTRLFPYYKSYLESSQIASGLTSAARVLDVVLYITIQLLLIYKLITHRHIMFENDRDGYEFGCILAAMNVLSITAAILTMRSTFMVRIKGILNYWTILSIPYIIKKFYDGRRILYVIVALLSIVYMIGLGRKDGDGVVPYMLLRLGSDF